MFAVGPQPVYSSGDCEIDLQQRELRVSGSAVPLGGRAFDVIAVLAELAGQLVTKDVLMHRVWHGAIVTDNTLAVHAAAIRKAMGSRRILLKTESGRGYRLIGTWAVRPQEAAREPIGVQRINLARETSPTNFPALVARLIGRSAAMAQLRDLLSAYRLVSVTGPGGIGKTVLAINAVRQLLEEYPDGGWLVELGPLSDPDLVPSAAAQALGLQLGRERVTAEGVARSIGARRLLVLLDNCEHVIEAAATLADSIVRLCPHVTVLATSREALRIEGEYVYRLPPLEFPAQGQGPPSEIQGHSAVELFITRVTELNSGFSPRAENLPVIGEICRHLDGIPLAIEFAAARAGTLGVDAVANGLSDRFGLLISGRRTALPRHRTMRATLDWSYEMLPEAERSLLRRLAVFPSGFSLGAVVAVMDERDGGALATADRIANLVEKSLLVVDRSEGGGRWNLLETVRAYAVEKLVENEEIEDAMRRSARYFADLWALAPSRSGLRLANDEPTRRAREIDNIRAALDWCFSPSGDHALGVELTAVFAPVWLHLWLMNEYRERCERALQEIGSASVSDARLQMRLQIDFAISLFDTMGSSPQARDLLTRALDAAESLGDLDAQAGTLSRLVTLYLFRSEYTHSRVAAEQFRQVAGRIGDPAMMRFADRRLGDALLMLGRPREAQRLLAGFLAAHAATTDQDQPRLHPGDHPAVARAFLARALWLLGLLDKAYAEAQASVDQLRSVDQQLLCRVLWVGMCRIASTAGHMAAAEQSIRSLIDISTSLNAPFWQTAGRLLAGKLMIEKGEFAQGVAALRDTLDTCRRTGWRMSYPEFTVALATGLAGLGRLDEAVDAVNEGLVAANWGKKDRDQYVAEALRTKGEILLQRDAPEAAETCFYEALDIAREQEALLWELRVALSLAGMRVAQGRAADARSILMPVYVRFTEGFEAPDLRAARELLDELSS